MAKPPEFSEKTKETLAARAAHICSNPDCSSLTVGPSDSSPDLKLKVGEAAHICGGKKGSARFDEAMTDQERADIENGIWLCARCHTLVDKNGGRDFESAELVRWKKAHEDLIRSLLLSAKSPVPILRRFTRESRIAQEIIDLLEGHGALYMPFHNEVPPHVVRSFDRLRNDLQKILRRIKLDDDLRTIVKEIRSELRSYMNVTGVYSHLDERELETARGHIGVLVSRLVHEYGARVQGSLHRIMP